ncbi:hypothetical protein DSO57_1038872 [Entomophthora muscae]|uniref:Uncharacterized protein n=2 Tax=Entomophthora muscae TaxID=34485 RepID=A0ACC2SMX9_9FUNG|nr:hypothetical protein DSO57_1031286 [Entomophthora muscae]KAJ9063627.1 hypothetical protein DSO57_1038872 [Entomophthora muscae]
MKFHLLVFALFSGIQAQRGLRNDRHSGCRPLINNVAYDCGSPSDTLKIHSLDVSTNEFRRGSTVRIQFKGFLQEDVTAGSKLYARINTRLIRLYQGEQDLCEVVNNDMSPVRCPIRAGPIVIDQSIQIPNMPFGGLFTADVYAVSQTRKQIFNVKANIQLR